MGLLGRFRSSLTYPIAATLVLVTVVPVALVGLLLAATNKDDLAIKEQQYLTRQAVGLAKEVSLFFSSHRIQLKSTTRSLEASDRLDLAACEALLQSMSEEQNRSFIYLRIVNITGEGRFVRAPQISPENDQVVSEILQKAHEEALQGMEVEYPSVDIPQASISAAIFGYPLRSRTGEIWGTLEGVLDLGPLQESLLDDAYTGLLVNIIDGQGTVVVSRRPGQRGSSMAPSPLVQDFMRNQLRLTRVYKHTLDEEVGMVVGSVAPVTGVGWGVVVERPAAEAFAAVRAMQMRTLQVTLAAALVALAIGFAMSRRLIRPIQTLAGITSEIAEGNLAVRATVSGKHEIGRLAANFNNMAGSIEALVRRLKQALRQNQELFLDTIRTLAAAIDAKDPYTRGHSERVSSYSMAIARHIGFDQEEVFRIRISSILHDVGKLGIRDGILNKPGGLTDEEFAVMKRHTDIGAQIMSPIRMLKDIIPGIRNHHESWDGKGYPDRLRGDEIPLVARIIGVADTFDAMTTNRPYQQAMSLDHVVAKMRSMAGTRFDPAVIDAFLAAVAAGDMTPPPLASGPQPTGHHGADSAGRAAAQEVS